MANITPEQLERITAMDYETKMKWVDLYLLGGSTTKHIRKGKEYTAFYWSQREGSNDCIDENNLLYVAMRQAVRAVGHRIIHKYCVYGDMYQTQFMSIAFDMLYEDEALMNHIYKLYSDGSLDDYTEEGVEADSDDEEDEEDDEEDDEDGGVSTQSMTHTVEEEVSDDPSA
jgi:hypothetical protein